MSARTRAAETVFSVAMKDSHDLMALHTRAGRGRRYREPALNRAVAVMTVAAWQAFVQDLTEGILSELEVPPATCGRGLFDVVRAATSTSLGRFNTPNAHNTLSLFQHVGFDPTGAWRFRVRTRPYTYSRERVEGEIDEWLRVRHAIAHGSKLPDLSIVTGRPKSGPKLHKFDAEHCIEFFSALVSASTAEADGQFP